MSGEALDVDELEDEAVFVDVATPHSVVSSLLKPTSEVVRQKLELDVRERLGLDATDARTLVMAAADHKQLRKALDSPKQRRVGNYEFQFIEVDIVTWRVLPSPENVRFEDQRSGRSNAMRYASLQSEVPVLTLDVDDAAVVVDLLAKQSRNILQLNPHAKTIPVRGIEVPGILSFARMREERRNFTVGYLDATDGSSRTAGAHWGLGITAREVLLGLAKPDDEAEYRKGILRLRDSERPDNVLTDEQLRKLRSSVMPGAFVITGFRQVRSDSESELDTSFDRFRRTLVGHIHMAPPFPFSLAAQWAAKANAIRERLLDGDQLPTPAGMDPETAFQLLDGNEELIEPSNLLIDEYAVFALEAFRPALTTKRGKLVQAAIIDLTGQRVSPKDLATIAAEAAIRPVVQMRQIGAVQFETTLDSLRTILGRAWEIGLFSGVSLTCRSVMDLLEDSIREHRFAVDTREDRSRAPKAARAELAALASFNMVVWRDGPLLERAVGRKGTDTNMAEPGQVLNWMLRTEEGLKQLAQIVLDCRADRVPVLLPRGAEPFDGHIEDAAPATAKGLRERFRDAVVDVDLSTPETPQEQLSSALLDLANTVAKLTSIVEEISNIRDDVNGRSDVPLVTVEGAPVETEISAVSRVAVKLQSWADMSAEAARNRRRSNDDSDFDLG